MADGEYMRLTCAVSTCDGQHKAQGYCLRHYRQWQRGGVKQDATSCAHCGKPISGIKGKMYCGKQCKQAAWKANNPIRWSQLKAHTPGSCTYYTGYCEWCNQAFGSRRKRKHCTERCDRAAWYAAHPVSIAPDSRVCPMCLRAFAPASAASMHSRMCSDVCAKEAKRRLHKIGKLQRNARLRGVSAEKVDPLRVFERDKWRCKLCGCKTPKAKRGTYADDAPELDHILPLSKGGEHSYRNTQCACRRCNGSKSDKPMGQLLLIG